MRVDGGHVAALEDVAKAAKDAMEKAMVSTGNKDLEPLLPELFIQRAQGVGAAWPQPQPHAAAARIGIGIGRV